MTGQAGILYLLHIDRPYIPYPGAPAHACAGPDSSIARSLTADVEVRAYDRRPALRAPALRRSLVTGKLPSPH